MRLSASIKKTFSVARILGSGDDRVALSENELFCLLSLCCRDLMIDPVISGLPVLTIPPPNDDYYHIPLAWFLMEQKGCQSAMQLINRLAQCVEYVPDFQLYFENLAALHKRRLKYQRILSAQPMPVMDQIGPRSLLEFGCMENELLASWLVWRKWIFDIDNRAAQETGYLFEPVLASCLGGESVSARHSPVKRLNEYGEPTEEGRQIDCYDGENQLAYEFKLRVSIAASGQGRFAEELSFPREAHFAGLTPILIVLDPTPSSRLDELIAAFKASGGDCYCGSKAWRYLESKAGKIMSVFLEKYIRPPLEKMAEYDGSLPCPLELRWQEKVVAIISQQGTLRINRRER